MEDEKDRKRYVTRLDLLEHGDKLKKRDQNRNQGG